MPRQEREGVADEDGRFAFERVPEGINCIQVNPINSQDHMQGFLWAAQVVAGETTEVRTFDRGKDRRLEVSIVVGNGSHRDFDLGSADRKPEHALLSFLRGGEPSFALELVPRSSQVCSFPADTNPGNRSNRGRIRLNDVSPGVYHLSLLDAPEYVGAEGSVLYEHDVLVRPGAPPWRLRSARQRSNAPWKGARTAWFWRSSTDQSFRPGGCITRAINRSRSGLCSRGLTRSLRTTRSTAGERAHHSRSEMRLPKPRRSNWFLAAWCRDGSSRERLAPFRMPLSRSIPRASRYATGNSERRTSWSIEFRTSGRASGRSSCWTAGMSSLAFG